MIALLTITVPCFGMYTSVDQLKKNEAAAALYAINRICLVGRNKGLPKKYGSYAPDFVGLGKEHNPVLKKIFGVEDEQISVFSEWTQNIKKDLSEYCGNPTDDYFGQKEFEAFKKRHKL